MFISVSIVNSVFFCKVDKLNLCVTMIEYKVDEIHDHMIAF